MVAWINDDSSHVRQWDCVEPYSMADHLRDSMKRMGYSTVSSYGIWYKYQQGYTQPNTVISAGSRADSGVLESIRSLLHLPITFMQTINRFLYGPTPEERVRAWQAKLRQESRVLDREMRQVRPLTTNDRTRVLTSVFSWTLKLTRSGKPSSNSRRRAITSQRGSWRVRSCEVTNRRIDSQ